jgi:PAS domain S-box-containing protein
MKVIPEQTRTDCRGVVHVLHTTKVPFRPVGSDATAVLGVSLDITDLKRAEERIRLLSWAVEQSPVSIVITDHTRRIVYVNPQFTRVTGYTTGEAIGSTPQTLKSGAHSEQFYRNLWETITAGQEWRGTLHSRRKNGTPLIEAASISPVTDGRGQITHFLGVLEDVTERTELEAQLRQAQRMEAVGILAGGVAHDFNNLLTVIGGYTQMALGDLGPHEPLRPRLEQVDRAATRAAGLTRQLLAFSRQLPSQPRVMDVNAMLEETRKMLRRLIGEDVTLRLEPGTGLGQVRMDPGHVEQVVMNLVVNARDAMPRGGVLTLSTDNVELDEAYAGRHLDVVPGRYVRLTVRDTGVGMDAATQARIFEPFFTTKAPGQGTGLGLSTVYGIVKQAGGSVWVESTPAQGTRFDVYLPRVDEEVEAGPASRPLPVPGGEETILLVEDDDDVRSLMATVLRTCGYVVLEARHPGEALLILERHPTTIHGIVTDIVMPQMSGWELVERAHNLRPDVRVVYVSGYPGEHAARVGLGAHVDFLPKPVTPTILALKVREVLDRPTSTS